MPRVKATSLRSYWMSTRRSSRSSRSTVSPLTQADHHALVIAGRTQAVDARHAGDDDDVLAADQGAGGGQAQAVDVLVDEGVFFDVDVALRDVGFGLVVVVVADEVVDGVAREEAAELLVELGGQRLVVRQDQRRLAELGDDVGRGEGLAGAGGAQQRLAGPAVAEALDELGDGLRLIAGGLELADELRTWLTFSTPFGITDLRRPPAIPPEAVARTWVHPGLIVAGGNLGSQVGSGRASPFNISFQVGFVRKAVYPTHCESVTGKRAGRGEKRERQSFLSDGPVLDRAQSAAGKNGRGGLEFSCRAPQRRLQTQTLRRMETTGSGSSPPSFPRPIRPPSQTAAALPASSGRCP